MKGNQATEDFSLQREHTAIHTMKSFCLYLG